MSSVSILFFVIEILVEYWLRDFDFDLLNVESIVEDVFFLLLISKFLRVLLFDIALVSYRIVHLRELIVAEMMKELKILKNPMMKEREFYTKWFEFGNFVVKISEHYFVFVFDR